MNLLEHIKSELHKLLQEDYDRSMKLQEFDFINRLDGWQAIQNGPDNFSFINEKYKLNIVCTPCKDSYNYGGKGAIGKIFPWDLQVTVLGTNESIRSGGNGCTKELERSFNHYLKWFAAKDAETAHQLLRRNR